LRQGGQLSNRHAHRVGLLQADEPHLNGQRPQAVMAADAILLHQAQLAKAHQIGVGLGRRHLGLACQILERHAPARARQHLEQLAADFHALYAARGVGSSSLDSSIKRASVEEVGMRHDGIVTVEKRLESLRVFTMTNRLCNVEFISSIQKFDKDECICLKQRDCNDEHQDLCLRRRP
jgi:hypothetical protein